MSNPEEIDIGYTDILIWAGAKNPYVAFVSAQVMRGVVEHPEVPPDWIEARMGHIQGQYGLGNGDAYEAVRLSEELAHAAAA